MKLTWSDIEAHRSVLTDAQYRRMKAYFKDGKSLEEIEAQEGNPRSVSRRARTSIVLGMGRGSMAVLNALLGRNVRSLSGSQRPTTGDDSVRPPSNEVRRSPGEGSNAQREAPRETENASAAAPAIDPLKPRIPHEITPTMRVMRQRESDQKQERGQVESVTGEWAVVVWDSGRKSFAGTAELTPLEEG